MITAYSIVRNTPEELLIKDVSNDYPRAVSITNAAEEVVRELFAFGKLKDGQRLLYIDTDGRTDELLHSNGRFVDFKLLGDTQ